jgi:hypothetical protein
LSSIIYGAALGRLSFPSMFCPGYSKTPSLRLLAASVSSSPRRPLCPLSSLNPRSPITTSRLASRRLSNMLDPKSLMEDRAALQIHYRPFPVSLLNLISCHCPTCNVTYSVPRKPFASKSAGAFLTYLDSLESLPRRCTARLTRSSAFESPVRVVPTVASSSPYAPAFSSSLALRIPSWFPNRTLSPVTLLQWTSFVPKGSPFSRSTRIP